MKKFIIIAVIFCCFFSADYAFGWSCDYSGWWSGPDVIYYNPLVVSFEWASVYILGYYSYDGWEWCRHWSDGGSAFCMADDIYPYWRTNPLVLGTESFFPVYEWDGDLESLYASYCENFPTFSNCCNYQDALAEAIRVKELIDSGWILDYLNETWPNGSGGDPNFEITFSTMVELMGYELEPQQPPYENNVNTTEKADPVFMSNGEYAYSITDLSIQGRGLSVEIVRAYGSRREYNSKLGYGWDVNYNTKIRRLVSIDGEPNSIILLDGGGYRREYTQDIYDPNLYERETDLSDYLRYDGTNNTFALVKKSGVEYNFDPNGNLTTITDENGNSITFTYNSNGLLPLYAHSKYFYPEELGGPTNQYGLVAKEYQLKTITDDIGRQIDFYYGLNGLLSTITDFAGRTWTYTHDPCSNDLIFVEDPNGRITEYVYDLIHNLKQIRDPNGDIYITNHYDAFDKVYQQVYGDGEFVFDYNSTDNIGVLIDREGHESKVIYTDSGQIKTETIYTLDPDAEPNSFTTQHFYDSNTLELTRTIYPAGNCIDYTYDDSANVTGIYRKTGPDEPNDGSDSNVIAITYTYDLIHIYDVNSVNDPAGNITTFEYDANGNVERITYPTVGSDTPIVEYTYNSFGQVETVTAPDGIVTKYEYYTDDGDANNFGHLWKVIVDANESDPSRLELTTEYKYDLVGNVIEVKDPNGDTTKFEYNEIDQLTKTTSPSPYSYVTNFSYNKNKKLSQTERVRSGGNQITSQTYDLLDNLETVTNPLGDITTYGYTRSEEPNLVVDAEDHNTISLYNERGLLVQVTDANGGFTRYTYTANGDINDVNDAKGNMTSYEYDGFGRLVCFTYPDDSNEVFSYNKNSNITSKKNRTDQIIYYEYDALNRLEVKNRPGEPNIVFDYDIASRVTEVDGGGGITSYLYDRIGRVNDVNTADSKIISYEYGSRGLRTKLVYPDDSYITYEYDALGRLTKIKDSNSPTPNVLAAYEYDELSRRTLLTLGNDANAVYDYDLGNRLETLTNNLDDTNSIVFDYNDYDKVGNRLSCKIDDANTQIYEYDNLYQLILADYNDGNSTSYYYDPLGNRTVVDDGSSIVYDVNCLNQYTAVGPQGSQTSYYYDANGNLADDGTYLYYYDCENRLLDVNDKATSNPVVSYGYDYQGRRISKTVSGGTTKYCYDGDQVIAEYNGSDTLLRKFVYGLGIDEPICMIDVPGGNKVYYYHFDGLGSVIALSNVNSVIVERYSYDVFGEPNRISDVNNPYYFTGRRYDSEAGLYYYRARYYDPNIGRFLQTDPIGYDDGLNMYRYCFNNPLDLVDPDGKKVAWATRDIAGLPVGNHHFILIIPDNPGDFPKEKLVDMGGGQLGFTLDAGNISGRLQYRFNDENNTAAVRESFNNTQRWYKPDLDFKGHKVAAPSSMTDTAFIKLLLSQASNYAANEASANIAYNLRGPNCATWVNSMFGPAGISGADRIRLGEFFGFDWGEEESLGERYFKKCKK
ncbi:RHS repeat protein [Candidatus Pacearchaeota archaeon]|nr:RHS repeat protein [Candidatus Pacearchaeota archaeon]